MPAFVNYAQQEVNLASQDEFPEQRHRSFRRVGHYAVAAIREPFELHEVRRQCGSDVCLAFDRVHRIVLAAEHLTDT
jgi:hypothetical protein